MTCLPTPVLVGIVLMAIGVIGLIFIGVSSYRGGKADPYEL